MKAYLTAAHRIWVSEWRYTYRSARREWPRRTALRKLARELWKGALDLPAYAREIRRFAR